MSVDLNATVELPRSLRDALESCDRHAVQATERSSYTAEKLAEEQQTFDKAADRLVQAQKALAEAQTQEQTLKTAIDEAMRNVIKCQPLSKGHSAGGSRGSSGQREATNLILTCERPRLALLAAVAQAIAWTMPSHRSE